MMERYSLDNKETSPVVKVLQILFGVACLLVAGWWAVYMISSEENNGYWIATLFMLGFGAFQIYSGLGYAAKYIVIDGNSLTVKKSALSRKTTLASNEIRKIEILPLSVNLVLATGQAITISFVMSIAGSIDSIKDAMIGFAEKNSIEFEERSDR